MVDEEARSWCATRQPEGSAAQLTTTTSPSTAHAPNTALFCETVVTLGGRTILRKKKLHNLVDVGASRPHVFDGTLGRCAASAERHLQYLPRCRPATLPEGGRRRAARLTMLLCQSFTAHPPTTCPFRTHHPLARLFARYGRTSTSFGAHSLYTDAPLITAIRHATGRKQAELV